MKEFVLTEPQAQGLRDQRITDVDPGSILRDFSMILGFVGSDGIVVGGKYSLIPLKFIGELDRRLSRPLHLDMKRPQLRSHPYLQGLNLLLRASGLSRIEGSGTKARLVLVPEMMVQWERLNPTERYFQLLEAWFRIARAEMVGERGRAWGDLLLSCLMLWRDLPAKGLRFDPEKHRENYMHGIGRDFYQLALMDLFGLLEVRHPTGPIATWSSAGIDHTPFGDALFTLIASKDLVLSPESAFFEDEADDEEEGTPELPRFGAWQAVFRPYFPEWRENLELPKLELREGEFVFRVSLPKVWRLIAMPAETTLGDLVAWILRSMEFDSDHLYEFRYRDRLGADVTAGHPAMEEGPWADEIRIGTIPLEPGQVMQLEYDFGDSWRFSVKLERIDTPAGKAKGPRILESHGKAPGQYPNWDE